MAQSSVDMSSGQTVYPFADSPYITEEGFILRGSNPENRARFRVYRLLLQREIVSNVAHGVTDQLTWSHDSGNPVQVFNFNSLRHLTHSPILPLPSAKRQCGSQRSPTLNLRTDRHQHSRYFNHFRQGSLVSILLKPPSRYKLFRSNR